MASSLIVALRALRRHQVARVDLCAQPTKPTQPHTPKKHNTHASDRQSHDMTQHTQLARTLALLQHHCQALLVLPVSCMMGHSVTTSLNATHNPAHPQHTGTTAGPGCCGTSSGEPSTRTTAQRHQATGRVNEHENVTSARCMHWDANNAPPSACRGTKTRP